MLLRYLAGPRLGTPTRALLVSKPCLVSVVSILKVVIKHPLGFLLEGCSRVEAELVLAPELMLIKVSNAHLAEQCLRMVLLLVQGLGRLAADFDKALHLPSRTGPAGSTDQGSGYEGAV